ncbi:MULTISPECIES: hypothetical protein [unclassified Pseudoxanthomonas]|uniref:hypothetical protein n=1 Tax=unclassified Pseudoxanthomonas TaxID=2645906 RepID=UPI0030789B96
MLLKSIVVLGACLAVSNAYACKLSSGVAPFQVSTATASPSAPEELKPPEVRVISVTRGVGTRRASCDDTGLLTLQVEWPRGTDYKVRDLGFQFRVVSGETAYALFPAEPVAGKVEGRQAEFLFMWQDGPPAEQQPIRLEVEVRAVTQDHRLGPPTRFVLDAAPGR